MKSFDVIIIEKREKTLLISAETEIDAMLYVQKCYVKRDIDMDNVEDRLVKVIVDDARAGLFAVYPGSGELVDISEVDEYDDWDEFDDDDNYPYLDDEYGYHQHYTGFNPCDRCEMREACDDCIK